MNPELRRRLFRVANNMKQADLLRRYRELVQIVGSVSNKWSAVSSDMAAALKNGDTDLMAKAIRESNKYATFFEEVAKRNERVLAKLSGES